MQSELEGVAPICTIPGIFQYASLTILMHIDNHYSENFGQEVFDILLWNLLSSNCFNNLHTQSNVESSELFIAISLHILKGHSTLINYKL